MYEWTFIRANCRLLTTSKGIRTERVHVGAGQKPRVPFPALLERGRVPGVNEGYLEIHRTISDVLRQGLVGASL
jgi:hypothetical protein